MLRNTMLPNTPLNAQIKRTAKSFTQTGDTDGHPSDCQQAVSSLYGRSGLPSRVRRRSSYLLNRKWQMSPSCIT